MKIAGVILGVPLVLLPVIVAGIFLAQLVRCLTAKLMYAWSRRVDRSPFDLSVALVFAPLASAMAAILAGVGVNLISSEDLRDELFGFAIMVVSLIFIIRSGSGLLKAVEQHGGGLTRIRRQLYEYAFRQSVPDDLAEALILVRRMKRVGNRLTLRADALTFRRWARQEARLVGFVTAAWFCALLVAVLYPVGLAEDGIHPSLGTGTYVLFAIVTAGTVLAPTMLVLHWRMDRWWFRVIGAEISADAQIAEKVLMARVVPRAGFVRRLRSWAARLW
ncbi:hypothetical protein [Actinoallomurus sp. CA-150999]|uniref:hypothetical protein n=1 Tax=Actinoallomurus sp. CA-150999 TaxID=3239887 RepID=UPI003D949431